MAALETYLPWLLSAITIWMTVLAGNKHRIAWLVGLANQALWLIWIVGTETWGLVPMNIALWIVYARNHLLWNADREKGPAVPSDRPVTPKYTAARNGGHLLGRTSVPPPRPEGAPASGVCSCSLASPC